MSSPTPLRFSARHVHLVRGVFAILVALMITFSPDHSAEIGLAAFSGFAIATGLIWALSAWLVYPSGRRGIPVLLAFVNIAAGMISGITPLRSTVMFFAVIISWAALTGLIEVLWGARTRKTVDVREGKDGIIVGAIGLLLAVLVAVVPAGYTHVYQVQEFEGVLTGTTIAVGMFGGYAAIIGVFLAIAGMSPRQSDASADAPNTEPNTPGPNTETGVAS